MANSESDPSVFRGEREHLIVGQGLLTAVQSRFCAAGPLGRWAAAMPWCSRAYPHWPQKQGAARQCCSQVLCAQYASRHADSVSDRSLVSQRHDMAFEVHVTEETRDIGQGEVATSYCIKFPEPGTRTPERRVHLRPRQE